MQRLICITLFLFAFNFSTFSQNTVGLISHDFTKALAGYNLMFPHNQSNVYLMNNCGQIAHVWKDSTYQPGNSAYLQKNGHLYKAIGRGAASNSYIHAGGGGEGFEIRDWNNKLIWRWMYNDSAHRPHHDFTVMPNGHILAIVWDRISGDSAIRAGRNPSWMKDGEVWGEKIIEIQPIDSTEAKIVWEWSAMKHIVQSFDSTKFNYQASTLNANLIDINFGTNANDWLHINSIDFHPQHNQILLSVPTFNEIWIIDHSTTNVQSAAHYGGLGKRGGDLMFRWGNPLAYGAGSKIDQMLFYEHHVHWIDLELKSTDDEDFGKIMIFNNRAGADYSAVNIIDPVFDTYEWRYEKSGNNYLPSNFDWVYTRPDSTALYSTGLSSAQRLANGNTLICSGQVGYTFEVTKDQKIVWEYVNPMNAGKSVSQGTKLNRTQNQMFRMTRYPANYEAFVGKDLKSKGYIELNPDTAFCNIKTGAVDVFDSEKWIVYPNPTTGLVTLRGTSTEVDPIYLDVTDVLGRKVFTKFTHNNSEITLDLSHIPAGIYSISVNKGSDSFQTKIVKQ